MATTTALSAYTSFMLWFQREHPALYNQYWQHVTAPGASGEVNIDASDLPYAAFIQLMQVQFEYYVGRQ